MAKIIFPFPGNELLADKIIAGIEGEKGNFTLRQFPDGESYLRVLSDVKGKDVFLVCSLHQPDGKILPLLFLW